MALVQIRRIRSFLYISTWLIAINMMEVTSSDVTTYKDSESQYFFYQQNDYPKDCYEVQTQCSSNNASGVYLIKPDGYWEPFEVFCDISATSKGWTVIHRRHSRSIKFGRDWNSYKAGFGFLFRDFWLGNEKISYLTNQKNYQLLIDLTTFNGTAVKISYDNFRIRDEFGNFAIDSMDINESVGNIEDLNWCPGNVIPGNIQNACLRTCEHPDECHKNFKGCTCPDGFLMHESNCVPQEQCGCYTTQGQRVIPEGGIYVDDRCERKGVCTNGIIEWSDGYTCGTNARCEDRDGIRQCYCNEYYAGDGQNCTKIPADCQDIYNMTFPRPPSGIYKIQPHGWPGPAFDVYCKMDNDGGWTVFQRRMDGSVDFYLYWEDYKTGFGNLSTEFWLGNEKLYYLTQQDDYEIRIDLINREDNAYNGRFTLFRISGEDDHYRLSELGTYDGNVDERSSPDGYFIRYHFNQKFSTRDSDNDAYSSNCAYTHRGGWWYNSCYNSNLNGDYHGPWDDNRSIICHYMPGPDYNIKYTEMKLRPRQRQS